ncbi:helix-turn-helix transcriptional regulator [Vibrio sp. Of7-15]|uniref:helix-turn-helix transcriptional regulator n=1 Tax=Vibrio sp. Of7-15 TaxID=2724879 RepID=UPI001EF2286C|nr:helix-turn-helix transcriptional regulator [Vibrio sp. Of7-15]
MAELDLITKVVKAIQTPSFTRVLNRFITEIIDVDSTVIVGYQSGKRPVYLFDSLSRQRELLFNQYLPHHYTDDPFFNLMSTECESGIYCLKALIANQGFNQNFQADFYQSTHWKDELGIICNLGNGRYIAIFLGRFDHHFSQADSVLLTLYLELVVSLCGQHWKFEAFDMSSPPNSELKTMIERALDGFGEGLLTNAEHRVAKLLLLGLDSEGIAKQHGVKVGTVKNQRKKIYKKMKVASLGELFSSFLNHAINSNE